MRKLTVNASLALLPVVLFGAVSPVMAQCDTPVQMLVYSSSTDDLTFPVELPAVGDWAILEVPGQCVASLWSFTVADRDSPLQVDIAGAMDPVAGDWEQFYDNVAISGGTRFLSAPAGKQYKYLLVEVVAEPEPLVNVRAEVLGPIPNTAPVADAGEDQVVECACRSEPGTQVTLDGSGSSDADDDPLTYTWTGPFLEGGGTAHGETAIVTLDPGCLGDYIITLVVNDGQVDSDPDEVAITVEDTTAPAMTAPGDATVEAMGPDGVPVDDDRIQAFLDGASASDDCDPEPVISNNAPGVFPVGDTVVTFTATDASGNAAACFSTVTVVEAAESQLRIVPRIINREGRLERILGVIRFPEGYTEDDIDMDEPLVLYPGDSPDGIEATNQKIVTWYRWGTLRVSILGFFRKDEVTGAVPEDGWVECMVVGRFVDGQYFYGTRTVKIVSWD